MRDCVSFLPRIWYELGPESKYETIRLPLMNEQRIGHLKIIAFISHSFSSHPLGYVSLAVQKERFHLSPIMQLVGSLQNSPYSPQQLHREDRIRLLVQEEEHSHFPLEYSREDHQCTSVLLPSKWEDEWDKSEIKEDYWLIGRVPYLRDTLWDVIAEFALAIVLRRRDKMIMRRMRKRRTIERWPWTLTRITSGWGWIEMVRMMQRSKINISGWWKHTSSPGRTHQQKWSMSETSGCDRLDAFRSLKEEGG